MKLIVPLVGAAALFALPLGAQAGDTPGVSEASSGSSSAKKDEVICKIITITGSRLPMRKRICNTRQQWEEMEEEARREAAKMVNSRRTGVVKPQ